MVDNKLKRFFTTGQYTFDYAEGSLFGYFKGLAKSAVRGVSLGFLADTLLNKLTDGAWDSTFLTAAGGIVDFGMFGIRSLYVFGMNSRSPEIYEDYKSVSLEGNFKEMRKLAGEYNEEERLRRETN
ncbi:MAG: hypothetical protein ABIJ20_03625 [Nanoarchaeota archaeon]|nr:hypothetical protein [Nanoarchaeota archaeon]MBU1444769.1 hypothetical protein [Nanoarchaeota archaeon]MBU2406855.1 hypothetical protein [Nanoarchaeota archaeon]MBU2420057.1 hypothetical protein [Nanoarchaeota archaeon]MBU2474898.1 hypothetical protein [Nanoarchaeota archaeon]